MISVCMATYNGAAFIEEQMHSILSQLSAGDEVIVSDDGSTDGTQECLRRLNDPRIRFYANSRHGFVHNFENALRHAKGDFIFLSDQDDIWMPNKVERCLEVLQTHLAVNHNSLLADETGRSTGQDFFSLHKSRGGYFQTLLRNAYSGCCMAFRKEMLRYALPFPPRIASHDIWLGLVAEKHGRCCFLAEPLLLYRRHGDNASSTSEKSRLTKAEQLRYRAYMFIHSLTR